MSVCRRRRSDVLQGATGQLTFNYDRASADAALEGHDCALLATWLVADHLGTGSLVRPLPNLEPMSVSIQDLWPPSRRLSERVRFVVDELARHFTPRLP